MRSHIKVSWEHGPVLENNDAAPTIEVNAPNYIVADVNKSNWEVANFPAKSIRSLIIVTLDRIESCGVKINMCTMSQRFGLDSVESILEGQGMNEPQTVVIPSAIRWKLNMRRHTSIDDVLSFCSRSSLTVAFNSLLIFDIASCHSLS